MAQLARTLNKVTPARRESPTFRSSMYQVLTDNPRDPPPPRGRAAGQCSPRRDCSSHRDPIRQPGPHFLHVERRHSPAPRTMDNARLKGNVPRFPARKGKRHDHEPYQTMRSVLYYNQQHFAVGTRHNQQHFPNDSPVRQAPKFTTPRDPTDLGNHSTLTSLHCDDRSLESLESPGSPKHTARSVSRQARSRSPELECLSPKQSVRSVSRQRSAPMSLSSQAIGECSVRSPFNHAADLCQRVTKFWQQVEAVEAPFSAGSGNALEGEPTATARSARSSAPPYSTDHDIGANSAADMSRVRIHVVALEEAKKLQLRRSRPTKFDWSVLQAPAPAVRSLPVPQQAEVTTRPKTPSRSPRKVLRSTSPTMYPTLAAQEQRMRKALSAKELIQAGDRLHDMISGG